MLKIDATTLYTKSDLQRELAGTMSVTTFLFRVKPRSFVKGCYWGRDLITALDRAADTRTDGAADRLDGMTSTGGAMIAPMPRRLGDDQGDSLTRTRGKWKNNQGNSKTIKQMVRERTIGTNSD
jgi:hypothetical protein